MSGSETTAIITEVLYSAKKSLQSAFDKNARE